MYLLLQKMFVIFLSSFLLVACERESNLGTDSVHSVLPQAMMGNPDGYMEVDCMLPGQVRKLGTMVYASPRRPAKTTANDCTIRGGEYVLYDRANYREALAVWMVDAEGGDALAQSYVGEIYMKSPPGKPRYDLAAKWFERAAQNGNKRAQVNLAYLYENGLGMQPDPEKALYWYSVASGSGVADIVQRQQLSQQERAEFEELKETNSRQLTELQRLKNEQGRTEKQLQSTRQALEQSSMAVGRQQEMVRKQRNEMEALEAQLAQKGSGSSESLQEELAGLRNDLALREGELTHQQRYAAQLTTQLASFHEAEAQYRQTLSRLRNEKSQAGAVNDTKEGQIAQLQHQAEEQLRQINRLAAEKQAAEEALTDVNGQLNTKEAEIARQRQELTARESEMAKTRDQLTSQADQEATHYTKKLEMLRQDLKSREEELLRQKERSAELGMELKRRQREQESYKNDLAALAERLADLPGPRIELLDPQLLRTRGITVASVDPAATRSITGMVWTPAGLDAFSINGKSTEVDTEGRFTAELPLSGKQQDVLLVAVDTNGKKEKLNFVLRQLEKRDGTGGSNDSTVDAKKNIRFGRYYALVIGNNEYRELPKLRTAVEDARVIGQLLKEEYGFTVRTLFDADRTTILSTLNDYRRKLTEKDNLLIYYAGHGTLEERNTQGFWLPVDSSLDDDVNWIPTDRITGIMNLMSAKQIMVVADACYSGIMTRASLTRLDSGKSEEAYGKWLKKMAAYKSRVIISSGENKPVLDGGGGKHSVFARAFIETLTTNHKILLGIDLHRAIAEKVVDVSGRIGHVQVPQYAGLNRAGHELGDFLFVPKNTGNSG